MAWPALSWQTHGVGVGVGTGVGIGVGWGVGAGVGTGVGHVSAGSVQQSAIGNGMPWQAMNVTFAPFALLISLPFPCTNGGYGVY